MALFNVTFFEFVPSSAFPVSAPDSYVLTPSAWDATFGAAQGSMIVDDPTNDVLQDDEPGIPGVGEDATADVTYNNGTVNAGTPLALELKYTFTWTNAGGAPQTTVVGQVNFPTGASVAVVTGPIPPVDTELTLIEINAKPELESEGMAYLEMVCFTRGTMILTDRGEVAVEDLETGDLVLTRDRGAQPLRWVGSRTVAAHGPLAPITIRAGALGNDRDLVLSPAHRVLIEGWKAEVLFGQREVLATARQLTVRDDVFAVEGGEVEYFHLLFDNHEIVTANGAAAESLNPSDLALDALETEQRAEIRALFPDLLTAGAFPIARRMLRDTDLVALY